MIHETTKSINVCKIHPMILEVKMNTLHTAYMPLVLKENQLIQSACIVHIFKILKKRNLN